MSKELTKTQIITRIAMTVAVLIAGGYAIFILSSLFPLPGVKYLLMTPYLSLIITVVLKTIHTRYVVLKINTVFALIMSIINIYMGLAILLTGICAQVVVMLLGSFKYGVQLSAASYSAFTVGSALLVSRFLIGGVFEHISVGWIATAAVLAFAMGLLGSILGNQIAYKVRKGLSK